jgi:uncharacterized UPF0160 family protein
MDKYFGVGTHDGIHHADEAMAVDILMEYLTQRDETPMLIRSRKPADLQEAWAVVDVGGKYDPDKRLFDHHQRGGALNYPDGKPMASAGLVWLAFGRQVFEGSGNIAKYGFTELERQEICARVGDRLIRPIDMADTGSVHAPDDIMSFSRAISMLNPIGEATDAERMKAFHEALHWCHRMLVQQMAATSAWVAGRRVVRAAFETEGPIMVLSGFETWQEHLCGWQVPTAPKKLFVVYKQAGEASETWMVQCVPPEPQSFKQLKPLPEAWAGLRDKDLAEKTGVKDAVFCHPGRFICGAGSKQGALKLAELALAP